MRYPSANSNSVMRALLCGAFALSSTAIPVHAVDYVWSPGGVYNTGGSGTWATSAAANWSSDSGSTFVNWTSSSSNKAIFGGTDGTAGQYVVSVGGNFSIQGININSNGYRLESSTAAQRSLSNNSTGVVIAAGKSATFNNVALSTGSHMSISGGGTLTLETGANFSSNQSLNVATSTTVILAGGNYSGPNTTVNQGSTATIQHANSVYAQTATGSSNGVRMQGNGIINLDGGTLSAYRLYNNSDGVNPTNTTLNLNGGTLQTRSGTAAPNFLSVSNAYIKEGGVTFDTNGVNTTTSQVLQHGGVAPTDGGLTKSGAGSLTLTGASTYTGTTTVNAGSLLINGSLSAASAVTVKSGATLGGTGAINGAITVESGASLGGTGTVNGAVTVLSGGILSPGSSPGVANYTNNLVLNTSSAFTFELIGNTESGRGTNFDGVNLTGGSSLLTIQSGVTANLVFNGTGSTVLWSDGFWSADHSWLVFDSANAPVLASAGIFDTIQVGLDSVGATSTGSFSFSENGSGDIYLNYTAVPEPSTVALLAVFGLFLTVRRPVKRN